MAEELGIEINGTFYPVGDVVSNFISDIGKERTDYRNVLLELHRRIEDVEDLHLVEEVLVKYGKEGLPEIPYIGEGGEA